MASIRQHPTSGNFLASFRFGGRQFTKSLKTKNRRVANAHRSRIEETIRLLVSGRIQIPPGLDPGTFILSDGKASDKQKLPKRVTLRTMFAFYRDTLPEGAKEDNTLRGEERHCEHLERILGRSLLATDLSTRTVQEYVVKRAKEKWNKRLISPQTIKKELTTLRLIWNWCKDRELVTGRTPTRGVVLPKSPEKPRFMTIGEIQRTIKRGGVTKDEQRVLWESLILKQTEVSELLDYVKENAKFRFIYPMFVFIAHTGVRRSEMMRSRIDDVNSITYFQFCDTG